MKKIILLLAITTLLSCFKTQQEYELSLNTNPTIQIMYPYSSYKQGIVVLDSIKNKIGTNLNYLLQANEQDKQNPVFSIASNKPIGYSIDNNSTSVSSIQELTTDFVSNTKVVKGNTNQYLHFGVSSLLQEGLRTVTMLYEDELGGRDTAMLQLYVFNNLAPIANFTVYKPTGQSEHTLDATSSIDADSKFGGHIVQYTWIIDGNELSSPSPTYPYYFNTGGIPTTKTIQLKVTDDEGLTSTLTQNIIIQ